MGHKNSKGTVSITNFRNRIRLRWRYQNKRYSLNLNEYSKVNLLHARKKAVEIEHDMMNEQFDFTLNKYKPKSNSIEVEKTIVNYFKECTRLIKQRVCEKMAIIVVIFFM